MLPIFLIDNPDEEQEIASMPGVKRMGINAAIKFLDPLIKIGLKSVLLFAVTAAEKVGRATRNTRALPFQRWSSTCVVGKSQEKISRNPRSIGSIFSKDGPWVA